ncbi:MAG: ABC transporter ATP-binding protein [Proteobacteria bacterium]|nr:ABC transporter ATP-binding protein [Pseudomonadota bacterium]MCP4919829.1 ABC transporter ATP-binding protein [Pseudomonadota bacterium]
MAICTLTDVGKTYPLGDTMVHALQGVSLSIDEGEFLAFSGPSGSGKTTLLNLVGCLDTPTTGSIQLDGRELAKMSRAELGAFRAKNIGFVFQSFNLIPVLSAVENVEVALRLGGAEPDQARCEQALVDVGLGDQMMKRPSQMSGGQQQRVAIARALVKSPRIVIADEPTANLDSKNGEQVLDLMRRLNEDHGATFLFSTHDPIVMDRVRRTVHLRDGRVISQA